jgi:hypothetical protein
MPLGDPAIQKLRHAVQPRRVLQLGPVEDQVRPGFTRRQIVLRKTVDGGYVGNRPAPSCGKLIFQA